MDFQFFVSLIQGWGYPGAIAMGFLSSFTLFLPTPGFLVVFAMAAPVFGLNPWLLGICAGFGAALGESIGYMLGFSLEKVLLEKFKSRLDSIEKQFQKYKPTVVIFVFAATPLPFDIVGIFCGMVGYSAKKFFLATLAGKIVKYVAIALAGFYGFTALSAVFGWG
jgi:membrane protein YqaA with SNARE-associated domain